MEASRIYKYDCETHEQLSTFEGDCYIDGSHDTDWEGILVEKILSTGTHGENVYIKDCHIMLAIDDLQFMKNTSSVEIEADDIVIAGRNKPFNVDNPGGYTAIFITLSIDFMKTHFYDKNIDHLDFLDFFRLNDDNLKYMVLMIYQQAVLGTSRNDGYLIKLFETLTTYYIHNYSNYFEDGQSLITKSDLTILDNYILDHLADNITSKELAELLNMSHYTFMKEFKDHMGMAPSKYILKLKYDLAKKLLVSSNQTVTEIANVVGFFDNSHLTNFFKKRAGLTPKQYRNSYNKTN